jgi:tetratricopeptide (TPR) repeat protein
MGQPRRRSRPRERDLDIEIGFVEALLRRDPGFVEGLEVLGDLYSERGRHADAVSIDERLVQLRPEDPNVRYNLACSLSLHQEFDRAAAELGTALELGYRDVGQLTRDPDLADLRAHPAFRKVRAKLRALKVPPA